MLSNNPVKYPIIELEFAQNSTLPQSLREIPDPPKVIYLQGSEKAIHLLQRLPDQGLAVVGTRNPQPRSLSFLDRCLKNLKNSDLIIVSGFAIGIDAAAHTAALNANLPTIAVLGAGLKIPYPRQNSHIRNRILESNGLLISEYPPEMPAMSHQFILRNRLIAGWTQATWVVEAGMRSGALNTARWAREQNRTCFANPCFPNDPSLQGNQTLLDRDHALPLWDVHNLGAVWIDLAAQCKNSQNTAPTLKREESLLVQQVHYLTASKGGATLQELFDWAAQNHWKSEEFFFILRNLMQQNRIYDHAGILTSSGSQRLLTHNA